MLYNIKFLSRLLAVTRPVPLRNTLCHYRAIGHSLLYIGIARPGLYTPHEDWNMFTAIGTHYRRIIEESWEDKSPISPDSGPFI